MEERRVGDGEPERPPYREFSVLRFCQKSRGEFMFSRGDDWNGDESVLRGSFCYGVRQSETTQRIRARGVVD